MDPEELARRQIEQELEQIGEESGMEESVCMANLQEIGCVFIDEAGGQHLFTFAPLTEE